MPDFKQFVNVKPSIKLVDLPGLQLLMFSWFYSKLFFNVNHTSGGYLIFTMRDGYQHTSQTFSMLDQSINDLVNDGSAQLIVGPVVFSNFLLEHSGR